jgi:hypothetical protein
MKLKQSQLRKNVKKWVSKIKEVLSWLALGAGQ